MLWWTLWIAALAIVTTLAALDLQIVETTALGGVEAAGAVRERRHWLLAILFMTLISLPAILLVAGDVRAIIGD